MGPGARSPGARYPGARSPGVRCPGARCQETMQAGLREPIAGCDILLFDD